MELYILHKRGGEDPLLAPPFFYNEVLCLKLTFTPMHSHQGLHAICVYVCGTGDRFYFDLQLNA
jgi:hypothetical protein